jgi:hypothetical protein
MVGEVLTATQSVEAAISAPTMAAPLPATTFAPVTASTGTTTLVTAAPTPIAANDESMGSPHAEDIVGILSIRNLPARKPLQMEATAPVYLRPRDAITGLHRLLSSAWSA